MIYSVLVKDVFETVSYLYIDKETRHCFIIDPGAEAKKIINIINENNFIPEKILLTHGHFDHLGAVEELSKKYNIPYLTHRNGERYLTDTIWNLSSLCDRSIILPNAQYVDNDDIIESETKALTLKVIHTPGHTKDSVIFYSQNDKIAFVGDTIFKGSIGSTQYYGSDKNELADSIINKIFSLPNDVKIYSGHSDVTTVGAEKNRYKY